MIDLYVPSIYDNQLMNIEIVDQLIKLGKKFEIIEIEKRSRLRKILSNFHRKSRKGRIGITEMIWFPSDVENNFIIKYKDVLDIMKDLYSRGIIVVKSGIESKEINKKILCDLYDYVKEEFLIIIYSKNIVKNQEEKIMKYIKKNI